MWVKARKLYCLLIFTISHNSFSAQQLKIAILDNFKYQNYVTTRYKNYYIEGVKIAQDDAKNEKIDIQYKIFQYNESSLSIYEQIPKLTEWDPDMVIGPRDSNKFLMLSPYFKDILVLSPFATSLSLRSMPNNFFSLTLDDNVESKAIYKFIQWKYPNNNLIILSETDCKSCYDVSHILSEKFKGIGRKVNTINYLAGDGETIALDTTQLQNSIIIISGTAHDSAVLMARISHGANKKVVFIGGDGWGAWKDTEVGKLGDIQRYSAYHIVPWSLELNSATIKSFSNEYQHYFKKPLEDKLTYIIYRTIMSAIKAYDERDNKLNESIKVGILEAYRAKLAKNENWFKPTQYMVYEIDSGNNKPYAIINIVLNKIRFL